LQQSCPHSSFSCAANQHTDVFRQAWAAERKTGLKISLCDVQLAIRAQQAHHRLRIGAESSTDACDLVGEGDLQSMESVVGDLHKLGLGPTGDENRSFQRLIEVLERLR